MSSKQPSNTGRNWKFSLGILSFLLTLVGYYFINTDTKLLSISLIEKFYTEFRLGIPNFSQILVGAIFLGAGAFIFAILTTFTPKSFGGIKKYTSDQRKFEQRPHRILLVAFLLLFLLYTGLHLLLLYCQPQNLCLNSKGVSVWLLGLLSSLVITLLLEGKPSLVKIKSILSKISAQKSDFLIILILMTLSFLVTIYSLDRVPKSIIPDEGYFLTDAKQIISNPNHFSFFGLGTYTFPAASNFYQAFFLKTFGFSIWSWRFSSVMAGVMSVPAVYLLVKLLFKKDIAIITALITTFSPYFLSLTRLGYNNIQTLPIVTWAILLMVVGLKRDSKPFSLLGGIVAGLSLFTYTAARLSIVLATFIYLAAFIRSRNKLTTGILIIFFFWGFLVCSLPRMIYDYEINPQAARNKLAESFIMNGFYVSAVYPELDITHLPQIKIDSQALILSVNLFYRLFTRNLARSFTILLNNDLLRFSYPYAFLASSLTYPLTIFFTIGLFISVIRWKEPEYAVFLLWFLAAIFLLSILNTFGDRHWHLVPIIPSLSFFSALGFSSVLHSFTSQFTREGIVRTVKFLFAVFFVILASKGLQSYYQKVPLYFPANAESLLAFEANQMRDKPLNLIFIAPTNFAYGSNWKPWYLQNFETPHKFRLVFFDQIDRLGSVINKSPENYIFFDREVAEGRLIGRLNEISNFSGEWTFSYDEKREKVAYIYHIPQQVTQ